MIAPLLFQDLDLLHPRLPCQLTLLCFQHDLVEDYRSNNYDDYDDDFRPDYDYKIKTSSSSHVHKTIVYYCPAKGDVVTEDEM